MGSTCEGAVLQGKFADKSFGYFPTLSHIFPNANGCLAMSKVATFKKYFWEIVPKI